MRKGLLLLILPASLALIVYITIATLNKYAETGGCYRNGSTLSAKELRMRTIRSLLAAEVQSAARRNVGQVWVRIFLISKSMTSDDVINAIKSKSIINIPDEAAYQLKTDRDVANIDPEFFQGNFSIIQFGASSVSIIPSKSIVAIAPDVAQKDREERRQLPLNLSQSESMFGYGSHYFRVHAFRYIDLGCCEPRYSRSPKNGKSPEWYSRQNIKPIETGKSPSRLHLVVSNCGDLLHRNYDGDERYLF